MPTRERYHVEHTEFSNRHLHRGHTRDAEGDTLAMFGVSDQGVQIRLHYYTEHDAEPRDTDPLCFVQVLCTDMQQGGSVASKLQGILEPQKEPDQPHVVRVTVVCLQ